MNETEARTFRAAYGAAVTRYTRMSKSALHREWLALLADQGIEHLYGAMSKDELLAAVLNLRGYTIAKLNETTHVLHHQVPWPDCEHCQDEAPCLACIGRECHCDHPAQPMSKLVPTGTGWPVGS